MGFLIFQVAQSYYTLGGFANKLFRIILKIKMKNNKPINHEN